MCRGQKEPVSPPNLPRSFQSGAQRWGKQCPFLQWRKAHSASWQDRCQDRLDLTIPPCMSPVNCHSGHTGLRVSSEVTGTAFACCCRSPMNSSSAHCLVHLAAKPTPNPSWVLQHLLKMPEPLYLTKIWSTTDSAKPLKSPSSPKVPLNQTPPLSAVSTVLVQ